MSFKKSSFLSICLSVCLSCTSSTQPLLLKAMCELYSEYIRASTWSQDNADGISHIWIQWHFNSVQNTWHLWMSFKKVLFPAPLQHNLYSSKIAEHVLPSYAKFKNLLNWWKFWLNDTNQVWLSKNWKELDVYSRENYSVFTNLLYNNDFKDYVIARTSVIPPSHVESSFISDKIFRSCFFGSVI